MAVNRQQKQPDRLRELVEALKRLTLVEKVEPLPDQAEQVELSLSIKFPASFRTFHQLVSDVHFPNWEIYRLTMTRPDAGQSIVEANRRWRADWQPGQWSRPVIAFANDGMGNEICFDTSRTRGDEYVIYSWEHERSADDDGSLGINDLTNELSDSFQGWLKDEVEKLEWLKDNP
ncbi:MAG: hypothetical protein GIKADHBN_01935 [Phycisphaerales bacterium]|nr:hypothetical protein [Phycisphaerales bacterium]